MTDTPKIEPVLTPLEWHEALNWPSGVVDYLVAPAERVGFGKDSPGDLAALIALANAALPDDDAHKITRDDVSQIILFADFVRKESPDAWKRGLRIAYKLLSYLPPER